MSENNRSSAAQYVGLLNKDFKHYCDDALEPFGLTNGLYLYLIYVNYNSGCSLADLKEGLGADKAYVTRVTSRLCQSGYLVKEIRTEDGRSRRLFLTPKGQSVFEDIKGLPWVWNQNMLKPFTDEEKKLFINLLKKACEGLELL